MKVEVIDKDAIIKIFKTISWIDSRRWNTEDNYNFINFFRDDLSNCEKILTHWICYITDRQMPYEIVWDKGGFIFSEIIIKYSRNGLSPQQLLGKHYNEYQNQESKKRFRFKSTTGVTFASRYITDDYQNILQTLEVLTNPKYKRNIVSYILDLLRRFEKKDDLLIRVACGLHLLTYQLCEKKSNYEKIIEIVNDTEKFENKLKEFKRTATSGKKRLWCCIRDYKKGAFHRIFCDAIKEIAPGEEYQIELWKKLPMNQIELPGDVWNNSPLFRDNLFANVLDIKSIPETWGMPKVLRELYNQLKENVEINDFYIEQFDITFDFVPRMCNKKLCSVCLFNKNGVELICIPTQSKYCPVALFSCGYIARCVEAGCILKKGISKGLCRGGLR